MTPAPPDGFQAVGDLILATFAIAVTATAVATGAVRWFWFHLRRGLSLMAVSTAGALLLACAWVTHRRRRAGDRDFTFRGIRAADQETFLTWIRVIHADLERAGAEADRRRSEREGP